MVNGEAGKGDTYRKVDQAKYDANYERIYGKSAAVKRARAAFLKSYMVAPFNGKRKEKV